MSEDLDPQVPGETKDETQYEQPAEAPEAPVTEKKTAAKKPRGLPDVSSIDPKKIDRAVLTAQGWIVPDKETPAARAKL